MSLVRVVAFCACSALLIAGCQSASSWLPRRAGSAQQAALSPSLVIAPARAEPVGSITSAVVPVAFQKPGDAPATELPVQAGGESELSLPEFVAEVQARNPSLQAMFAAWQAAAERYPQVVALDDPMFNANIAPASLGSNQVEGAYTLELSQKFPWFGKLAARGRSASADANAARAETEATKQQITQTAELAFFDYYLVSRQQEINRSNVQVMQQFRETAESRYRANQVTQQDMLQADLELAELDRRDLELQRMKMVAVARINTLLRQPPSVPLPLAPRQLSLAVEPPDVNQLQLMASQQRPELVALASQISARQADLELAYKQYYPDAEVYGGYDTYWQPASTQGDLRGQVGVRLNVPIYHGRLNAAVREASDRVCQKKAEYDQKLLDIQYEVQQAYAELLESQKAVALYEQRLAPVAEQNVSAARSNYDVGRASFLDLATAERQLIDIQEKAQEALAAYHVRLANLERAIGSAIGNSPTEEPVALPAPQ